MFDEEQLDPHGECAHEIHALQSRIDSALELLDQSPHMFLNEQYQAIRAALLGTEGE